MTITAPAQMPTEAWVTVAAQKDVRAAKDGETMITVRRPQTGPASFAIYGRGDYVVTPKQAVYVVVVCGKPYTVTGGNLGIKEWRQVLVVRTPTTDESAQIDVLRAASAAASTAAMRRALDLDAEAR